MIIVNWIESLPPGGILVLLVAIISAGLALIAAGKRPAEHPASITAVMDAIHEDTPAPVLTPAEHDVLAKITRLRPWAHAQDVTNARMIADGLRERAPHLRDAELGALVLDLHGYMVAARCGAPDAWAMARMTAAMGLAAVELTELERETSHHD